MRRGDGPREYGSQANRNAGCRERDEVAQGRDQGLDSIGFVCTGIKNKLFEKRSMGQSGMRKWHDLTSVFSNMSGFTRRDNYGWLRMEAQWSLERSRR